MVTEQRQKVRERAVVGSITAVDDIGEREIETLESLAASEELSQMLEAALIVPTWSSSEGQVELFNFREEVFSYPEIMSWWLININGQPKKGVPGHVTEINAIEFPSHTIGGK